MQKTYKALQYYAGGLAEMATKEEPQDDANWAAALLAAEAEQEPQADANFRAAMAAAEAEEAAMAIRAVRAATMPVSRGSELEDTGSVFQAHLCELHDSAPRQVWSMADPHVVLYRLPDTAIDEIKISPGGLPHSLGGCPIPSAAAPFPRRLPHSLGGCPTPSAAVSTCPTRQAGCPTAAPR